MSELIFVGGIDSSNRWLDDGKSYSRNYKQGSRVYSEDGMATALTSQPVGGLGGFTSLYMVDENKPKGSDNLTNITEVFEGKPFNYVSLFSGIGGFEQALNKLGGTCVMASEIDKYANQSYEILYGHPTVGDVTKVAAEEVPDHDLLVGGFPCQAFSVAGKRLGFDDTRGTLFFEIARIASTKQPSVLLLENVKGLISHDKGKTLDTIIKTLADIGYTVDFNVLNSKYFGVPQNRERIFIIAVRDDLIEQQPWKIEGTNVVAKGKRRISELEGVKTFNFDWPEQTEVTTRLRDILESNVDERYYLSEEKTAKLVAQLEERHQAEVGTTTSIIQQAQSGFRLRDESGTLRSCLNHQHLVEPRGNIENCDSALKQYEKFYDKNGYVPELFNPYNCAEVNDVAPTVTAQCTRINASSTVLKLENSNAEPQMVGHVDLKGHDAIKRVYSAEGVSPTLTTMGGGHREPKIAEEVRPVLTPDRIEKRQNGRRFKDNDEKAFTLTAQDRHGVALSVKSIGNTNPSGSGMNGQVYDIDAGLAPTLTTNKGEGNRITSAPHYRIRKLTPRECFRLQGFPDSEFDKLVEGGISNSQLYKQAGNAVTVNVISAIGKRLIMYLN